MEISPIPGIRALPAVKPPKNDPMLSAVLDIDSAFGPQQDTFSHNNGKMAGGQDDEADAQEETAESVEKTSAGESGSTVNVIA